MTPSGKLLENVLLQNERISHKKEDTGDREFCTGVPRTWLGEVLGQQLEQE